ncbi:MAG: hypothetical protein M1282_01970 [Chloroflexi bacterium]|nr:hypothetical protein [Chloroflexota bacterium]
MISLDLISGILAFFFSLMILSYLIGDNPLFRIAVYIFVGVSAGYVAAVAFWQAIWPDLIQPLIYGTTLQRALLAIPLVLSVLLLMKISPQLTRLGTPSMAILVGIGSAVAIGGAVTGTLFPQISATINAFDLSKVASPIDAIVNGGLILVGVVTTLAYFHFSAGTTAEGSVKRFGLIEIIAFVGGIFVAITLGVLFAGVYSAALTALIERLHFFGTFFGLGN